MPSEVEVDVIQRGALETDGLDTHLMFVCYPYDLGNQLVAVLFHHNAMDAVLYRIDLPHPGEAADSAQQRIHLPVLAGKPHGDKVPADLDMG